jgi:hypothetical protein
MRAGTEREPWERHSLKPRKTAKNALSAVKSRTLHQGMSGPPVPEPYIHPIPTAREATNRVRYHLFEWGVDTRVHELFWEDLPLRDFAVHAHLCVT